MPLDLGIRIIESPIVRIFNNLAYSPTIMPQIVYLSRLCTKVISMYVPTYENMKLGVFYMYLLTTIDTNL